MIASPSPWTPRTCPASRVCRDITGTREDCLEVTPTTPLYPTILITMTSLHYLLTRALPTVVSREIQIQTSDTELIILL